MGKYSKFKLFIENFLIFGFGGVISKLIPLIMVPIVTRIMPSTEYFGISDLSNTIVRFASAIAILGMYDAMYRLFFDKDDDAYKRTICSTTLVFTIITSVIVFGGMLLMRDVISKYFFGDESLSYVVCLSAMATLTGATNAIVSAPTRMQNKRRIYLFTNAITPLLSYSVALWLLFAGYYVVALPLAAVISGIIMEMVFVVINRKWFSLRLFDSRYLKPLLIIGLPLLPEFLIYWVFNSCDKVMITNMIGLGAAGIYSVGSKLGQVSQLIYVAFAGGWQYYAFSTMEDKDQVGSNSRIFEYLGIISFVATAFICAWSSWIFNLIFKEDYYAGYIIAPYLFLAPLLQMLFQVAANQFLVIKKTWPSVLILSSGAIVNVALNYLLIPVLGIEGASIASLVGYIISDLICVIVLCHMKLMVVTGKFITSAIFMVMFLAAWRWMFSERTSMGTVAAMIFALLMAILYRNDIIELLNLIKNRNKGND